MSTGRAMKHLCKICNKYSLKLIDFDWLNIEMSIEGLFSLRCADLEPAVSVVKEMSANMRVRERSCKVLQYYGTFISGYYGSRRGAPSDIVERARRATNLLSLCRKSIRLLNWVNHFSQVVTKLKEIQELRASGVTITARKYMELLEQIALSVYFFGDNSVLMQRAGVLGLGRRGEATAMNVCCWGDFMTDVCAVIHRTIMLRDVQEELTSLTARQSELEQGSLTTSGGSSAVVAVAELKEIKSKIRAAKNIRHDAWCDMGVHGIQLITSSNFEETGLIKALFGQRIPDTVIGITGMISSSIAIYKCFPWSNFEKDEEVDADAAGNEQAAQTQLAVPAGEREQEQEQGRTNLKP